MKKIVISAVNFTEGGPLSVLNDCLSAFQRIYKEHHLEITVFVHKVHLVQQYAHEFKIVEYPAIKSSWLKRLYFEYYQCKKISAELKPDLWIALHDITPNVTCKQVVYCHNPSPFYKLTLSDAFTDRTFFLFCLFYRFLYLINIKKNKFVIVQQQWIREEFERIYKVKTIVAYPFFNAGIIPEIVKKTRGGTKFIFFFPAYPRIAKNFEVLLQATKILVGKRCDFEVILSISGIENKYSENLYQDYKNIQQIRFIGVKTRKEIFDIYNEVDCMVFPSKLETWGLPITEFKVFDKPMLLADLKYAHETLGEFYKAKFFTYNNPHELAGYMDLMIDNKLIYDKNEQIAPHSPFFKNWDELTKFLANKV
jgi:glycosyltransferase involved in cell wall biosynthesis